MIKQCKYCGSEKLELENKTKLDVMKAAQVALKCADCGKWLKWVPKDERQYYIKKNIPPYWETDLYKETKKEVDMAGGSIIEIVMAYKKRITDLEVKLAESEKCAIEFQNKNTKLEQDIAELKNDNVNIFEYSQKVEQQLAEKDLEIGVLETALECACEDLQESNSCYINAIDLASSLPVSNAMQIEYERALSKLGYALDARGNLPEKYKKHNFKNILSLTQNERAIEQLEEVKSYFVEEDYDGDDIKTGDRIITKDVCEVADFIDNQIKQLNASNSMPSDDKESD